MKKILRNRIVVVKAGLCTRVFGMLPTNFSRGRSMMIATGRGRGTIFRNYNAKFELVVIKRDI